MAAGDSAGAAAHAKQHLHDVITTGTLQQQGFAVDALGSVRQPKAAPLLYDALKGSPEVRIKAAHALGVDLGRLGDHVAVSRGRQRR